MNDRQRNQHTDLIIEEAVALLVSNSNDGTYTHEDLAEAVMGQLSAVDVDALKRDHIRRRIDFRDHKQAELARATTAGQAVLPGELGAPQGEFALGGGLRVPKEKANSAHWVIRLQLEAEHISQAQASHAATLAEYAAYSPYLQRGLTTGEAYDAYRRANPDAQAAD